MTDLGPNPSEELLKRLCYRAGSSTGWMKLLGILSILQGIFLIFTIWGLLICWLPIWVGVVLYRAAGDADMAARGAPARLEYFLQRINKYFLIQGVLTLVGILIGIIVTISALVLAGMSFFTGNASSC